NAETITRIRPLLDVMGRTTIVGLHGAGQVAKLANQVIVGVMIGGIAEALALAKSGGADPEKVWAALRGGYAESRILELHGLRMVHRDFEVRSRATTQLKDLRNALSAARDGALKELPLTAKVAEL